MTDQPDTPQDPAAPTNRIEAQSGQAPQPQPPRDEAPDKQRKDRRAKFIFLIVVAVIAVFLYTGQVDPPEPPPGWGRSLGDALTTAENEGRLVVVAFVPARGRSTETERLHLALSKEANLEALQTRKILGVWVPLTDEYAERYTVDESALPVTLLLSPEGKVIKRAEGYMGEVPFRQSFIDPNAPASPGT